MHVASVGRRIRPGAPNGHRGASWRRARWHHPRAMRVLLAITAAALVSGAAAAAVGSTPARTPTLGVTPQGIHGRHFYPRERVRMTLILQIRETRQVRTSATGSFDLPLPAAYDRCTEALTIIAVGARGDSARIKVPQRAACPPA